MTPSTDPTSEAKDLAGQCGRVDIYVFDQLMRGHLHAGQRVLDAGCGSGRNVHYLMRRGAEVFGVDVDPEQIRRVRALRDEIAPSLASSNFSVASLTDLPFPNEYFGAVLCSAVLHFARSETEFESMVSEMWRVLEPGGLYFARLASTIGLGEAALRVAGRRHALPDGTERFLVDESYLMATGEDLGAHLVDPLKTTVVQGMRAMTTWVLRK